MNKNILLLSILAGTALADVPQSTEMKATQIAIFKNGYGFVTMEGSLGTQKATRLNSLPVPSLGTFWVKAEEGVQIDSLVSGLFDYTEPQSLSMMSLAAANPHSRVKLTYRISNEEHKTAEGTLLPFPKAPITRQGNTIGQIDDAGPNPMVGESLLLRTATGTLALNASNILNIEYLGDVNMPVLVNKRPCVELQLEKAAPGKRVQASCLSSGITWLPSYQLLLNDNGRATFNAKATITNQLVDLDNVSMELITGYPALSNVATPDPMAMKGMEQYARDIQVQASSNSMRMKSAMAETDAMHSPTMGGLGDAATGTDTGNLFFYPVSNFSAKVGQVITQPLFSASLDYKHIYTWEVEDPRYFPNPKAGASKAVSNIWDCIRFTNPLDMPLTAAPIEFIQQGRISGTNNLDYTPIKEVCTVRMGRAINFVTTQKCEVSSQETISYPSSNSKTGTVTATKNNCLVSLSIKNPSKERIEMEVTQRVQGQVTQVEQGGSVQSSTQGAGNYLDLQNTVRWTIQIAPEATQELKFQYSCIKR